MGTIQFSRTLCIFTGIHATDLCKRRGEKIVASTSTLENSSPVFCLHGSDLFETALSRGRLQDAMKGLDSVCHTGGDLRLDVGGGNRVVYRVLRILEDVGVGIDGF